MELSANFDHWQLVVKLQILIYHRPCCKIIIRKIEGWLGQNKIPVCFRFQHWKRLGMVGQHYHLMLKLGSNSPKKKTTQKLTSGWLRTLKTISSLPLIYIAKYLKPLTLPILSISERNPCSFFFNNVSWLWKNNYHNEPHHEKTCLWWFLTRKDSNGPEQLQTLARDLEFLL